MSHLELLLGPMFAEKTTTLISRLKRHLFAKQRIVLIKPSKDTRYTREALVTSHDGLSMSAITVSSLEEDPVIGDNVQAIGIDEGHFFKHLYEFCSRWLQKGVTIYVAALNGTFERKPFESISRILGIADNIVFLHGVCVVCGDERASCSVKTNTNATLDDDGICVGGEDVYTITCSQCYSKEITQEHIEDWRRIIRESKKVIKRI